MIALFCSTIPGFGFTPLSDESYIVQAEAQLSCRPCGSHGKAACPKRHFDCAHLINDERVASIILRKILQQQAERTLKEHFVTI
jgi:heptosyltransferase-2